MSRYLVTPAARDDLAEIKAFLAARSSTAPERVLRELAAAMERLAEMPGIGHLRADVADESLRFWSVYSYLIVYRPETSPVQVLRVLHGARNIRAVLDDC